MVSRHFRYILCSSSVHLVGPCGICYVEDTLLSLTCAYLCSKVSSRSSMCCCFFRMLSRDVNIYCRTVVWSF